MPHPFRPLSSPSASLPWHPENAGAAQGPIPTRAALRHPEKKHTETHAHTQTPKHPHTKTLKHSTGTQLRCLLGFQGHRGFARPQPIRSPSALRPAALVARLAAQLVPVGHPWREGGGQRQTAGEAQEPGAETARLQGNVQTSGQRLGELL